MLSPSLKRLSTALVMPFQQAQVGLVFSAVRIDSSFCCAARLFTALRSWRTFQR